MTQPRHQRAVTAPEHTKTADLRDAFAGQALSALITEGAMHQAARSGEADLVIPELCSIAYAFADGMMIERAKRIYLRRSTSTTPTSTDRHSIS